VSPPVREFFIFAFHVQAPGTVRVWFGLPAEPDMATLYGVASFLVTRLGPSPEGRLHSPAHEGLCIWKAAAERLSPRGTVMSTHNPQPRNETALEEVKTSQATPPGHRSCRTIAEM
jgi:hypothetical protein